MKKLYLIIWICIPALTSCNQNRSLEPVDYLEWVLGEKNDLKKVRDLGDYQYQLQLLPAEFNALMETTDPKSKKTELDEFKQALNEFLPLYKFSFKISRVDKQDLLKTGIASEQDYYNRIQYLSSLIENNLVLYDGNDTLNCIFAHFERRYGVSPDAHITVVFERKSQSTNNLTFKYDDQIFGTGPVLFTYKKRTLEKIPDLKLNKQ